MGIGDRPQGRGRQPDQFPGAVRQPARPAQEGRTELRPGIRDGGLQVARRGALPRHTPQQRHQAMGSSIAARHKHHAHIQGILQGLLRQIPQTGRQQAIRPVQPMQRNRTASAQRDVRRHPARPHHPANGRRMVCKRQRHVDGMDVRTGGANTQTNHARRRERTGGWHPAAHPREPVPVPRRQTAIQTT